MNYSQIITKTKATYKETEVLFMLPILDLGELKILSEILNDEKEFYPLASLLKMRNEYNKCVINEGIKRSKK